MNNGEKISKKHAISNFFSKYLKNKTALFSNTIGWEPSV